MSIIFNLIFIINFYFYFLFFCYLNIPVYKSNYKSNYKFNYDFHYISDNIWSASFLILDILEFVLFLICSSITVSNVSNKLP